MDCHIEDGKSQNFTVPHYGNESCIKPSHMRETYVWPRSHFERKKCFYVPIHMCSFIDFLFEQSFKCLFLPEVTYGGLHVLLIWQNGAEDVKKHRWFKTVDWEAVPNRKLKVTRFHLD